MSLGVKRAHFNDQESNPSIISQTRDARHPKNLTHLHGISVFKDSGAGDATCGTCRAATRSRRIGAEADKALG